MSRNWQSRTHEFQAWQRDLRRAARAKKRGHAFESIVSSASAMVLQYDFLTALAITDGLQLELGHLPRITGHLHDLLLVGATVNCSRRSTLKLHKR